ncbi:MAG: hypothetical protein ACREUW_15140 [Burkholderiales bacterium]
MEILLLLSGALAVGAFALGGLTMSMSRGVWSAGYWWSDGDRRRGPGC